MADGERSLDVLLQTLNPSRVTGTFRFITHTFPRPVPRMLLDKSYATVREDRVLSLVVRIDDWPIGQRDEFELRNTLQWSYTDLSWITLTVRCVVEAYGCAQVCDGSRAITCPLASDSRSGPLESRGRRAHGGGRSCVDGARDQVRCHLRVARARRVPTSPACFVLSEMSSSLTPDQRKCHRRAQTRPHPRA